MALTELTKVTGPGIHTLSNILSHNIKSSGIITATKFSGPLDSIGGNFAGVITATNGVFSGNISAVDGNFSGNVTIGGTLTYEDVTNIDSVGIITAQKDIHVGAGVSAVGVGTFGSLDISGDIDVDGHTNLDNVSIAGVTTITSVAPELHFTDTNANSDYSIVVNGGQFRVRDETNSANRLAVNSDGHVDIYGRLDAVGGFLASSNSSIEGNLELISTYPSLIWTDTNHNSDYRITNNDGQLIIYDITNGVHRLNVNADGHIDILGHLDVGSGIDVTGNIIASGDITANGGDLTISGATAVLHLTDTNNDDDFSIINENGLFIIRDATNSANRISINSSGVVNIPGNTDFGAGIDVVGTIQDTGTTAKIDLTNSGTNATEQTATFFTSNSGTHNRVVIKTSTNNGGDPYIKFDAGGQDMVVGTRYAGTTNNLLVLGPGLDPDTTSGIFVKGNGNIGVGEDNPSRKLDVSGDVLGVAFMLRSNSTASPSIQAQMFRPADNTLAFATDGNNERLRITSTGVLQIQRGSASDTALEINTTATSGACRIKFNESGTTKSQIAYSHANDQLEIIGASGNSLAFFSGGSQVWNIDTNGHLLPNSAGAVNIGSASAEIGNVYIADSGSLYVGSDQDIRIWHNSGTGNGNISNGAGNLYINATSTHEVGILVKANNSVDLYYDSSTYSTPKLSTSTTGITVTGEVAATQDYPNQRPTLDFNFAKTKALDPRLSYIRSGPASYYDDRGLLVLVGDDTPRFDHDPMTRESKGILLEESRRNMQPHSAQYGLNASDGWVNIASQVYVDYNPGVVTPTGDTVGAITFKDKGGTSQHYITTDAITVSSGTTYTFSFFFKSISGSDANNIKVTTASNLPFEIRSFYFSGADAGTSTGDDTTITELPNGWWRGTYVVTANGNGSAAFYFDLNALNSGAPKNNVMAIYGIQMEIGDFPTSYIPTDGNYAIRGGDTLTMTGSDLTDVFNETEGTMFYEASLESLTRDNQAVVAFRDMSNTTVDYHAMGMRIGGGSSGNLRTWFKSNNNNEFLSNHASTGLTTKMFYKHIYGYKLSDCADAYRTATNSGIQDISHANSIGDGSPMITEGLIDELRFGEYYSLGDTYKMDAGHIKRFSYWTQKLTNTQLTTYIS